jgi:anti-anti-sigma factor
LSEFSRHELEGVTVVEAAGRLDALASPQLDDALKRALSAGRAQLVLDMARVSYVSSSALRVLLLGSRQARQLGGDLKLCCLTPRVHQVFALAGFDQIFQLWCTRAQALAAFAAPADGSERLCDSG